VSLCGGSGRPCFKSGCACPILDPRRPRRTGRTPAPSNPRITPGCQMSEGNEKWWLGGCWCIRYSAFNELFAVRALGSFSRLTHHNSSSWAPFVRGIKVGYAIELFNMALNIGFWLGLSFWGPVSALMSPSYQWVLSLSQDLSRVQSNVSEWLGLS